jgi:serine/threonine protein phosphatase 1
MITYVIGDLHGMSSQFRRLLDMIDMHSRGKEDERRIICVGDYIDRGPDSKGVLDILRQHPEIIALRGNHEDMLLKWYDGVWSGDIFLSNGGVATMHSFGIHPSQIEDFPRDYIEFIRKLPVWFKDEHRVYVHAGINPFRDEQMMEDILWIREPFLNYTGKFFKYVVHGHTPTSNGEVDIRDNRANVDSGGVFGGHISCLVFNDKQEKPIDVLKVAITL